MLCNLVCNLTLVCTYVGVKIDTTDAEAAASANANAGELVIMIVH